MFSSYIASCKRKTFIRETILEHFGVFQRQVPPGGSQVPPGGLGLTKLIISILKKNYFREKITRLNHLPLIIQRKQKRKILLLKNEIPAHPKKEVGASRQRLCVYLMRCRNTLPGMWHLGSGASARNAASCPAPRCRCSTRRRETNATSSQNKRIKKHKTRNNKNQVFIKIILKIQ